MSDFISNFNTHDKADRGRRPEASVPQNDDGLRTLASNGEWNKVLTLAKRLEQERALGNDSMDHLPYVLVRITAHFKLQQIPFAVSLVELLGDVEHGVQYCDPITGENRVPFSLRYVCALMPHYVGDTRRAIDNLDSMIRVCKEHNEKETQGIWTDRIIRIIKTLIALHFSTNDFSTAARLFESLLQYEEQRWKKLKGNLEIENMKRIMLLQQFACLSLEIGQIVEAEKTLVKIQQIVSQHSSNGPVFRSYTSTIDKMNQGFVFVFKGMFKEASETFRDLAKLVPRDELYSSADPEVKAMFHYLKTSNQVSYISCNVYSQCDTGKDPLLLMNNIVSAMETFLNENPDSLLRSSGFLNQAARLYALNFGIDRNTFTHLADLLEKYVMEKSAIPNLESLL